jgi:hypothetical protein
MKIFLFGSDTKSFHQHLAAMKTFRQSHVGFKPGGGLLKNGTAPCDACLSRQEKPAIHLTNQKGNATLVTIWQIEAAPGSQN